MKRIKGHQSDVASTIASKDPHNTFRWKCASEHTAGQSGSHAWRPHLPMQLLPRLAQALQTIKQEEENAGTTRHTTRRHTRNTTTLATKLLNDLHTKDGYVALLDVA